MQALDRRACDRLAGHARDLSHQGARVPVGRPALPQAQAPRDEDGVDLVAVAQSYQVPGQVDRGAKLRCVDIDEQEVRLLADVDLADEVAQADGARAFVGGMVEPGPAATA